MFAHYFNNFHVQWVYNNSIWSPHLLSPVQTSWVTQNWTGTHCVEQTQLAPRCLGFPCTGLVLRPAPPAAMCPTTWYAQVWPGLHQCAESQPTWLQQDTWLSALQPFASLGRFHPYSPGSRLVGASHTAVKLFHALLNLVVSKSLFFFQSIRNPTLTRGCFKLKAISSQPSHFQFKSRT